VALRCGEDLRSGVDAMRSVPSPVTPEGGSGDRRIKPRTEFAELQGPAALADRRRERHRPMIPIGPDTDTIPLGSCQIREDI
jgi:hypothetical protein